VVPGEARLNRVEQSGWSGYCVEQAVNPVDFAAHLEMNPMLTVARLQLLFILLLAGCAHERVLRVNYEVRLDAAKFNCLAAGRERSFSLMRAMRGRIRVLCAWSSDDSRICKTSFENVFPNHPGFGVKRLPTLGVFSVFCPISGHANTL
jgi:hypothetical protein